MKKIKTCLLLICLLTIGMISSQNVHAETEVTTGTYTYINPVYQNIIDPDDYPATEESVESADTDEVMLEAASSPDYFESVAKAGSYVRSCMLNRDKKITFCLRSSTCNFSALIENIIDKAIEHTGMPTEGDYLYYQFAIVSVPYSYWPSGGYYYCNYSFIPQYYTTLAQEKELNSLIQVAENEAFSGITLSQATDYEKLRCLYTYICKNVKYESKDKSDASYLLQFTAYSALKCKTAVCQGYANLFYRMALDAGIDCRIVSGVTGPDDDEGHAWNIVQLYGSYYNIDTTWGANYYYDTNTLTFGYFMKASTTYSLTSATADPDTYNFDSEHFRDSEYCTKSFLTTYPMSPTDYKSSAGSGTSHVHSADSTTVTKGKTVAATCTEDGYTLYQCNICKQTFRTDRTAALGHNYVTESLVKATPTKNGHEAGKYCSRCGYGSVLIPAPSVYISNYNYVYNGKAQKPKVTVKTADGSLLSSSYYTVSYSSGCKNVGSYKVTVTFKGKYTGSASETFGIFPKATTISKLSRLSKGFTVKWSKKTTQTTGYIIQYAKNKNFSGAKTVTISKYKTISKKISKLTKKQRYYVRIRTYKKVNGIKYVSSWSAVKSIVTK